MSLYKAKTNEKEIHGIINNLKANVSPGIDGIKSKLIKDMTNEITPVLDKLINTHRSSDDSMLLLTSKDNQIFRDAQRDLDIIAQWTHEINITLNESKCNYVIYDNQKEYTDVALKINNKIIQQ
ncbi:hypothetical protein HHI36_009766, partial [Cryptolaemus montrouzieri]